MIDWSKPLEAVHEDGRVFTVGYDQEFLPNEHWTDFEGAEELPGMWQNDGEPYTPAYKGIWRIRNVQPAAVPEYSLELVERMVNHFRKIGKDWHPNSIMAENDRIGIVALLPVPIDPDLIEAREIVAALYEAEAPENQHNKDWAQYCRDGSYDDDRSVRATLAALKSRSKS